MRKKGNNQAIRGGQFWLKSFSCEIRAEGGGERLMRDNKFAPKINPPTSEPKPRRVYIKHERELFMISHIEFGYRNLCKGYDKYPNLSFKIYICAVEFIRVENKSGIIEMIISTGSISFPFLF